MPMDRHFLTLTPRLSMCGGGGGWRVSQTAGTYGPWRSRSPSAPTFLDLTVQVPQSAADLLVAVELLDGLGDLRRRQQRLLDLTKTFREEMFGLLPEPAEA